MHLQKWQLPITVVCLFSGIFVAINLGIQSKQELNPVAQRNNTLVALIKSQEKKNHELEQEIQNIRNEVKSIQDRNSTGKEALQELQKQLDKARYAAGLETVAGPGIIITLKDQEEQAIAASKAGQNPEPFLIHFITLVNIVNDLKFAGAEAISINGIRIVTPTDIRCAGVTIIVNQERLATPYTIKAIGNKDYIAQIARNGEYGSLKNNKFPVTLEESNNVNIPAFKGSFDFNYANVVKGENK